MRPLSLLSLHFLTNPRPPRPTPFPYTTLFRSPVPRRPWSRHVPRKPRRAPGRTANSCTARGPSPGGRERNVSKTVNNTHRRAMRPVTPAVRAGRVAAGAALAAGMLFGGAASATAEPHTDSAPQADYAPQADSAPAVPVPDLAPVSLPAIEAADESDGEADAEVEPALAPAAGSISVEVGPTEEEIAAAEEAEREAAEQAEAEEREAAERAAAEERSEDDSASRSNERSSTEDSGDSEPEGDSSESEDEGSESEGDGSESEGDESESEDDGSESEDEGSESEDEGSESEGDGSESSEDSSEQTQSAPASTGKGDSILATARNGIGVPYVYGGTSTSGWDCSGFVQWVYGQHGIDLPRGAADQAAAGTAIPRSEAQPGDLVYKPGHIGIYAGGNKFVDAGNSRVDTSERNIYSGNWTFIRVG